MEFIKRYIFSLLTLILITTLSLMPAQEFPQVDVKFADKWAHWVMYGFLTLVMGIEHMFCNHFLTRTKGKIKKAKSSWHLLPIFLFSSIYGGLMELGQAFLTTSRHGDWLDAWANSFGALCAYMCLLAYQCVTKEQT